MSIRRIIIMILFALISIFYPPFVWANMTEETSTTGGRYLTLKEIQSPAGLYFDFSIGPGFLYFHQLKGNLSPIPTSSFQSFRGVNFGSIQKLRYNKTALYEADILARIFSWLKAGLAFYGQGDISVESFSNAANSSGGNTAWAAFRSDLQLYSLLFKAYVETPLAAPIGSWALSGYGALGVGPGWQSWTNNRLYENIVINNRINTSIISLRNKFSANAVWTADAGIAFQPATNKMTMQVRLGCKYIAWGQMREIGQIKDQEVKVGPLKPIKAKTIYSFAPYIGIRWCF